MTSNINTPEPHLWYPYTQMADALFPEVVRAQGVHLELKNGQRLLDAIASWWCVIHGYNHPRLNKAIEKQLSQFAHVMMGGLVHQPARDLAAALARIAPAGIDHVFFSDSGSVGMEVAMKMAIQYQLLSGRTSKTKFVSLTGGYHGDTFQTMSITNPDGSFHRTFAGVLPRHYYAPKPEGGREASTEQIRKAIEGLRTILEEHGHEIAGFVCEPLLQGAGGYYYYSESYLQQVRPLCAKYNVLLVYDEVATGFGRTGKALACDHNIPAPDILTLGKALTGGYLGLAATLASKEVFSAFLGGEEKVLMHGPTFMGNALACSVALESLRIFEEEDYLEHARRIETKLQAYWPTIKDANETAVKEARIFGASAAAEVHDPAHLEGLGEYAKGRGVWLRPFGKIVYTCPAYTMTNQELDAIINVIGDWFHQVPS